KKNDNGLEVSVELPGLEEKDVELTVDRDTLTIKGEKRWEHKEDDKDRHYVERRYGRFERSLSLPFEVDREKASASFKKGVLTIDLPKAAEARDQSRRIGIRS